MYRDNLNTQMAFFCTQNTAQNTFIMWLYKCEPSLAITPLSYYSDRHTIKFNISYYHHIWKAKPLKTWCFLWLFIIKLAFCLLFMYLQYMSVFIISFNTHDNPIELILSMCSACIPAFPLNKEVYLSTMSNSMNDTLGDTVLLYKQYIY